MFALLILIIQLVHSFNFDHPEVPTLFIWRIDESCLSTCKLNVTSKKANETVDFIPNTRYFSCDYLDDYQWNVDCHNDRFCGYTKESEVFFKYPQKVLYATKTQQEERESVTGLLIIRIPQCEKLKNGDCLMVEIKNEYSDNGLKYYGEPSLRYYGKNQFNCDHNYTSNPRSLVPYKITRNSYYRVYTAQFKLNCYSDRYYNVDQITFGDSYYFLLNAGATTVKYYLGNDDQIIISPSSPTPTSLSNSGMERFQILFWFSFGVILFLLAALIGLYLYFTKYAQQNYSEIQLSVNTETNSD